MDRIIIVGHGPSLKGKKLGKYIDAHENVVRLTTYLNFQNEEDYGNKTTYHFTYAQYVRYIKYNVDHYWRQVRGDCEVPIETWIAWGMESIPRGPLTPDIKKHIYDRFKDYNVIMFEEFVAYIKRLYDTYEPEFKAISAGTTASLIAIDRLKPEILKVIGFDNTYMGVPDNYEGGEHFFPGTRDFPVKHDFAKEKELLHNFAQRKGVTVIWEMLN